MNENMSTHAIILCMSKSPDPKNVAWRAELEAEKAVLVKRLAEITGPFKEPTGKL